MLVSILAAIYYRWELDDTFLVFIFVLPPIATALVLLDATILQLRDRGEEHKKASRIWGDWIRRAHEAKSTNGKSMSFFKIQKRYRKCINTTTNTSTKDFLKFKSEWIRYKNESMNLEKNKLWTRSDKRK